MGANLILPAGGAAAAAADYTVENSLKFNDGDSPELSRTYTSSATWTFSCWVKRGELGATNNIFGTVIGFNSSDQLFAPGITNTTAVYRDPSAWYHICVSDTGLFVNGVADSGTVSTSAASSLKIGDDFDGYLADVHFIDGTAKQATDFAEPDDNGQWVPKAYSGSYGTNGFHLDFSDSADLGADAAGSNDFSATNLGSEDQMGDTPSSGKNYATLNPLDEWADNGVFAEGNLSFSTTGAFGRGVATIRPSSGKWYGEVYITQAAYFSIGVMNETGADSMQGGGTTNSAIMFKNGATYYGTTYNAGYSDTLVTDNIVSFALDLDNDILWFAINGTWQNGATTGEIEAGTSTYAFTGYGNSEGINSTVPVAGDHIAMFVESNSESGDMGCVVNFGQDATFNGNHSGTPVTGGNGEWAYAPPSGFLALCTENLDADDYASVNNAVDDEKAFAATLYEGDGETQTVEEVGFQPDLVWVKNRDESSYHNLVDTVRGFGGSGLFSNSDDAEGSASNKISSVNSDGFVITGNSNDLNHDDEDYISWCWKAGTSMTGGSKNVAAGFSIVGWEGDDSGMGDGERSVAHGLTVVPDMIIAKDRDNTGDWQVLHTGLDSGKQLFLNSDSGQVDNYGGFGSSSATTSNFYINDDGSMGGYALNTGSVNYIAYCFASIEGYSKAGSYTANDLDNGPFIYCGFRPAFIIVKRYDGSTQNWVMFDTARGTYNISSPHLYPNLTSIEYANETIDILSNGFKYREDADGGNDTDGDKFIFYAVADNPFKYANAR